MFKGYYTLTSGMLTQNKNLNILSNNIVNSNTPGFKRDMITQSTFQEEMLARYGNQNTTNPTELGNTNMINIPQGVFTDYSIGGYEDTEGIYDFAISDRGFFQVQTDNGTVYTRNGAFIVDDERYLSLPRVGRVLGENGPIRIDDDTFRADSTGTIYIGDEVIDRLAVVDFADYDQLRKAGEGVFQGGENPTPVLDGIMWKALENSNVNMVKEMTDMITSQRSIQSSAQLLKIFDQVMAKATTDIGRI